MSLDNTIEEIKRKTEKAMKALPPLIDTYSSKLSDIKRRVEKEVDREKLRDEYDELQALRRKARREIMSERKELLRDLHDARGEFRSRVRRMPAGKLRDSLEDMNAGLDKFEVHVRDELDDIRDKLDLLNDRVYDAEGKAEDKIREWKRKMK